MKYSSHKALDAKADTISLSDPCHSSKASHITKSTVRQLMTMNPSVGTPSSTAHFNLGMVHGRYQTMTRTKDGKYVIVCRCCRIRDIGHGVPTTPSSTATVYTPSSQVVVDIDGTSESPEVRCLCFGLETLRIDALRRSERLMQTNKNLSG